MQDKYNNQELVNRGWLEMSKILNQEMPVGRKSRRVLWLWLVPLLLVVGLSSIWGIWYASQQRDQEPVETHNPIPIAEADQNELKTKQENKNLASNSADELENEGKVAEAEVVRLSEKQNLDVVEASKMENSPTAQKKKFLKNVTESQRSTQVGKSSVRNFLTVPEPTQKTKVEVEHTVSMLVPAHAEINHDILTGTKTGMKEKMLRMNRSVAEIASLEMNVESLSAVNLDFYHIVPTMSPMMIEPVQNATKFSLAAVGTANFTDLISMRSVQVGPQLNKKISDKFNVFAGVSYEFQKEGGILNVPIGSGNSRADLSAVFTNGGPLSELNSNTSYDTLRSLTNTFHYLQLPFGVEYKMNDRFSIRLGAKISRLIGASAKYDVAYESIQDVNLSVNSKSRNVLYSNNLLRKTDVAPTLGATLYLGKHFALLAEYNHGLVAVIDRANVSGRDDFNRLFSLGLRYTFSRF